MPIGKQHPIIQKLVPVEKAIQETRALLIIALNDPNLINSINLKETFEKIQYEIDKIAMEDAK